MAIISVTRNQPIALNVLMVDQIGGTPRTGLLYTDVEVWFARANEYALYQKILTVGDFTDVGNGIYKLAINSSETNVPGTSIYVVKGKPALSPPVRNFVAELVVVSDAGQSVALASIDVAQYQSISVNLILVDEIGGTPRTGLTAANIEVSLLKNGATSFVPKSLLISDVQELGEGIYRLILNSQDTSILGDLLYAVVGVPSLVPQIRSGLGQILVTERPVVPSVSPTLPICMITGTILDLGSSPMINNSVTAKVLETPFLVANVGMAQSFISTSTDIHGYFELPAVQGTTIDIVVPVMNFRRQLVVPAVGTADLFAIP